MLEAFAEAWRRPYWALEPRDYALQSVSLIVLTLSLLILAGLWTIFRSPQR